MTDSTWNAYDRQMTTPLLRCAPLTTPRGRCHGIHDEHLRRGAGGGSPFSFLTQESQTLDPSSAAGVARTSIVLYVHGSHLPMLARSIHHCLRTALRAN